MISRNIHAHIINGNISIFRGRCSEAPGPNDTAVEVEDIEARTIAGRRSWRWWRRRRRRGRWRQKEGEEKVTGLCFCYIKDLFHTFCYSEIIRMSIGLSSNTVPISSVLYPFALMERFWIISCKAFHLKWPSFQTRDRMDLVHFSGNLYPYIEHDTAHRIRGTRNVESNGETPTLFPASDSVTIM